MKGDGSKVKVWEFKILCRFSKPLSILSTWSESSCLGQNQRERDRHEMSCWVWCYSTFISFVRIKKTVCLTHVQLLIKLRSLIPQLRSILLEIWLFKASYKHNLALLKWSLICITNKKKNMTEVQKVWVLKHWADYILKYFPEYKVKQQIDAAL